MAENAFLVAEHSGLPSHAFDSPPASTCGRCASSRVMARTCDDRVWKGRFFLRLYERSRVLVQGRRKRPYKGAREEPRTRPLPQAKRYRKDRKGCSARSELQHPQLHSVVRPGSTTITQRQALRLRTAPFGPSGRVGAFDSPMVHSSSKPATYTLRRCARCSAASQTGRFIVTRDDPTWSSVPQTPPLIGAHEQSEEGTRQSDPLSASG